VNSMRSFGLARTGSFFSVLALLALVNFSAPVSSSSGPMFSDAGSETLEPTKSNEIPDPAAPSAHSVGGNSTYYTVRADLRRCASPMCGGFFIKRVNNARTRCANGRRMAECYVAEINWDGQPPVESGHALLRGELSQRRYQRLGRFGVLRVTESWRAASERLPQGTFFRVKDLGIRCITYPCLTHQEERLNSYGQRKVAGVELNGANASSDAVVEAGTAMTSAEGILVAGNHARIVGPAGRANTLRATQFYLRGSVPVAGRPCIKTGCSSQVCAEEEVMTTCEWRPEYECYRRARCERQANLQCGFTQTPELTTCLARR
jgi:hypothetical protein